MKRVLLAVALAAAGLSAAPAAAAEPCVAPEPVFAYDADEIVYTLTVDLRGCKWATKRPFTARGSLERSGGVNNTGQAGVATCTRRAGTCRLILGMSHLPVEVARYSGEISYVWKGKTQTFAVAKLCVAAALDGSCVDE